MHARQKISEESYDTWTCTGYVSSVDQLLTILQAEVALLQLEVVEHVALHGLCVNLTHIVAGRGGTGQSAVAEHVVLHGACMNQHMLLQIEVALLSQRWRSMLCCMVHV